MKETKYRLPPRLPIHPYFSAIRPQVVDFSPCFPFDETFEVSETVEDFTLLFNEVDSRVPRVVVDEGD